MSLIFLKVAPYFSIFFNFKATVKKSYLSKDICALAHADLDDSKHLENEKKKGFFQYSFSFLFL